MKSKYILLFLFCLSIQTHPYENQRQKLSQKLSELIAFKSSNYNNAPSQTHFDYTIDNSRKFPSRYIFDYMKVNEIDEMKNRYGFSELIATEIQSTIDNRITGVIDDTGMDFSKMTEDKYLIFKLAFASALKEHDTIYFMVFELSFHAEVKYNCVTREQELCYIDCRGDKQCETKKHSTPTNFMPNQIQGIIDEAYYKMFESIMYYAPFLSDPNVRLYISSGNMIFSEDGEKVAYIGEFPDIAIGPTKYLNSIQPLKTYRFCYNLYTFIDGEYSCFNGEPYNTNYAYPGQMVHKFSMLLGNVNPTSTVYTHRKQMSKGSNYYSLILYADGELTFFENAINTIKYKLSSKMMWTSNTKDKGIAPYKLKLSEDYRLQLLDSKNSIIYQSKEYINIPTIRYKIDCYDFSCNYPDSYNGYEINHSYYSTQNAFWYFQMGVADESYPNLQLDYYYLDGRNRWIKNKKPFSYVKGSAGYEESAKALKMMLIGPGSEKFKVCYYIRKYKSDRKPQVINSPIVCDGISTEVTDRSVSERFTSFIAFITLKTDTNPQ